MAQYLSSRLYTATSIWLPRWPKLFSGPEQRVAEVGFRDARRLGSLDRNPACDNFDHHLAPVLMVPDDPAAPLEAGTMEIEDEETFNGDSVLVVQASKILIYAGNANPATWTSGV